MSCNIAPEILEYIEIVEKKEQKVCKEQYALVSYIRNVFGSEEIYVDEQQLKSYLGLVKYFPYGDLLPWEKFIFTLWNCTYKKKDGLPRWKTLLCMVGRGAGKDGFIAFDSMCMVSPYNNVNRYNVDICANNEDQAMTPLKDLIDVLESPKYETKLKKHFYHTKELIQGRKNKGVIRGRTNNPKGRDGMRSGKVIFNEVHAFQNYDNIKVFITGQGKVANPRVGIFTSNGEISDGPLDDYLRRGRSILFDDAPDEGFLPFICALDSLDQVHNQSNWTMANPSLAYFPNLMQETKEEYTEWKERPEQNGDFIVKRMGIRYGQKEISVTDYEKIRKTNKPLPQNMQAWPCVVGIDYAQLNDWASVNFHFIQEGIRYDINHAWLCLQGIDLKRIKAPWKAWADMGLLTPVDDVSINPQLIAQYILNAGKIYNIRMIAMDHFRWPLMCDSLRQIGFDSRNKSIVKMVRPSDIMMVEPIIQECFDRNLFCWGDNPVLRWSVQNTKRVKSNIKGNSTDVGNFIYSKIEAKSRKNDPFMALVASMTCEQTLLGCSQIKAPPIGAIIL